MVPYTNLANKTPAELAELDKRFWRNLSYMRGLLVALQEGAELVACAKRSGDGKLMVRELDRVMYDALELAHYARGVVSAARGYGDTDERRPGEAPFECDPETGPANRRSAGG